MLSVVGFRTSILFKVEIYSSAMFPIDGYRLSLLIYNDELKISIFLYGDKFITFSDICQNLTKEFFT